VGKLASIGYGVENTYSVIKQPLIFWQCIQVLEILHAALGIVKSSVITTFVQVASRIIILLAIVYRVPEVQGSIFFTTLVVAWSLAEIPRYLHYALSLTGGRTTVATWLR
jgi:very-long-chain (3R)-3-hydroxyacyl-CoA dehydratase